MRSIILLIAAALAEITNCAWAQSEYPNRPITMIVAAGAGSTPDIVARGFSERLAKVLGQPIVVDSRTGANGIIAGNALLAAPANGYTFLFAGNSFLEIRPFVVKFPFAFEQFEPVSKTVEVCLGFFARPSLGLRNMKEFVAYMAENPGKINYGNVAVGSHPHLVSERLFAATSTKATTIPYKTDADILTAIYGGFADAYTSGISARDVQNVRAGKVVALATTCLKRMTQMPEVPTMQELGYSDFVITGSYHVFAAKGVAQDIVHKVAAAAEVVKNDPNYVAFLAESLASPAPEKTPEEFSRSLVRERSIWSAIVQRTHITVD